MEGEYKSIEFGEEELSNIQEIGIKLLYDENDPRSPNYVRKLNRPRILWWRIILAVTLPIITAVALGFILCYFSVIPVLCWAIPISLWLVYLIVFAKRAVICCVKIYQRYAPDRIRNKCRFEPSCSEYAILAIQKYGFFKGIYKSIGRLRRCNGKGGGIDFP